VGHSSFEVNVTHLELNQFTQPCACVVAKQRQPEFAVAYLDGTRLKSTVDGLAARKHRCSKDRPKFCGIKASSRPANLLRLPGFDPNLVGRIGREITFDVCAPSEEGLTGFENQSSRFRCYPLDFIGRLFGGERKPGLPAIIAPKRKYGVTEAPNIMGLDAHQWPISPNVLDKVAQHSNAASMSFSSPALGPSFQIEIDRTLQRRSDRVTIGALSTDRLNFGWPGEQIIGGLIRQEPIFEPMHEQPLLLDDRSGQPFE